MKSTTHVPVVLLLMALICPIHAEFITPVAVTVSNGEDLAESLIDGLGLADDPPTAESTHEPDTGLWSGVGTINAQTTFDLGGVMDITKVYIWNHNGNTPVGMKDVEVRASGDANGATARFTTIAQIALTEGGEAPQAFDINATDVRWIQLNSLTNWGNGFQVGLAEVRFESGDIVGSTPFVEVTSPKEGDVIPLGSNIDLVALIEDADDDLDKVEFFDGDTLLGEDDSAPYSFSVPNPSMGDHALQVKATDASGKAAWSTVNVAVRDVLTGEVIQIDDEADIGEGVNQITYSENWNLAPGNENDPRFNNNDHWSNTQGSWFEIKFTGAKIDLFATVASHHGTGTAQIDGGTEFSVSYQAEQRGEQALVWSSPLLPNREHTLRVTVDGTGVVTADRFDVTVPNTRIIQVDDEADIGEDDYQITYSDGWTLAPGNENDPRFNNNDHYSGNQGNWLELKFTGVRVDVYATVASHHGTATATIDGGTEVPISYQTDQRGEQVFIWSSPLLPNREHTLRITVDGTGVVTADRFDVHVPTTRIVQVDDEADIGEDDYQITYSENWNLAPGNENDPRFNNNDHWSNTKDSWFEVKFTGVKVDIYGTVASHHGTGTATIDGGTEATVSYQAEQRGEQVLVWESPELPNRQHTLRITVDGTGVVTADRFDIHVSDQASADLAAVNRVDSSLSGVQVAFKDFGDSVVDPASLELRVDGKLIEASASKEGDITTLSYTPPTPYAPGSEHNYQVSGTDTNGNALVGEDSFVIPIPPFSLQGLSGPKGRAGVWGFRQIWDTGGLINSLGGAVDAALAANQEGFAGKVYDSNAPVLNFSEDPDTGAGFFTEDEESMPADAEGLSDGDYVSVAHGLVKIPKTGDWTIGVISDEGFALRFVGATFASAAGNSVIDGNFSEFLIHPTNDANSNVRGVLQGLEQGLYEIEVITWNRSGGAHLEVYAAEGAFVDDGDTESWALIGSEEGLELVGPGLGDMFVTNFTTSDATMTVDFTSPEPGGIHEIQQSIDLIDWVPLEATFSNLGDGVLRGEAATSGVPAEYVRAVLLETPPIYREDFESGAEGWIAGGINDAETQWELGAPAEGPGSAFSGENVYGTDLDGPFAVGALVSLKSPVIDLEGQEGRPRLIFRFHIDATEGAEGGRLNFLDENGDLLFNDENLIFWGTSVGWEEYNRPVPAEVRGRKFVLEFQLLSDEEEPNGAGWYIDDVEISK